MSHTIFSDHTVTKRIETNQNISENREKDEMGPANSPILQHLQRSPDGQKREKSTRHNN